jgi:hypothetical protein
LIEVAYERAIIRYNIFSDVSFNRYEQNSVDRRFDDISSNGTSNYKVITYGQKYVSGGNVDCTIELNFNSLDENRSNQNSRRNFEKQIEDGYTITKDASGKEVKTPKYKTVVGYVDIATTRYTMNWRISADVRSNSKHCNLYDNTFYTSSYQDVDTYQLSGDQAAIPSQYKSNAYQRYDRDRLLQQAVDDLYYKVKNYYNF